MKRWFLRNFVCRFRGHAEPVRIPYYTRWFGNESNGTLHCSRCGRMIGSYGNVFRPFAVFKEGK